MKTYSTEDLDISLDLYKDGSFLHRYTKANGVILESKGKWSLAGKDCRLGLSNWYCYGKSNFENKPAFMLAEIKGDRISPYTDVPVYIKAN